ncbi:MULTISPECIES: fumarate hydratase [unclassified Providencia]|uniref:fumarate hydratase n=1 Tax=unclassified Providencia TaxID=2633465 RepID=UPI000E9C7087|nr:fumarate hydratase [Providencia sp.]MBP6081738.1 fumarate hydratase [Providencia sp.]HBO24530.1 fumarate hydratase [Providencia sp.]
MANKDFFYQEPYPLSADKTEYYQVSDKYVSTEQFLGKQILKVEPEALTVLAQQAIYDSQFFLRAAHQKQVAAILHDPEASENDKYVALQLLRNAEISAKGILPNCQDTGTATILAKKGQQVWTDCNDEAYLSRGVYNVFTQENLRYSQNAALDMYNEVNTGTNLPAQIDIFATEGDEYHFLFVNKGAGSANKSALFQETKTILEPAKLKAFLIEKMKSLGTTACPPYHIAFVIGGTSAEATLKATKLASTKYYDNLPTTGNEYGRAFRDVELEDALLEASRHFGFGAQFGGKYFAHDVRIIRLPRHGGSCPIGLAISCSSDRNIKAKINKEGLWIEKMEHNPAQYIPESMRQQQEGSVVHIDLNRPMKDILAELSKHPVSTRVSLSGPLIIGRDIAHAKLKERLDNGEELPQYFKDHMVYYAGPAKKPEDMVSGSLGPTTGNRMDPYVDLFQSHGGSMLMLAKGNRTQSVTDACKKHGGFYLGSIGGSAAILAQEYVKSLNCLEYPELGMEAIWKMEVEGLPAFILVDDKGNNFFEQVQDESCKKCIK